jgi:hypothetical protein
VRFIRGRKQMQIAAKKNAGAKRPAVVSQRARFRDAIYPQSVEDYRLSEGVMSTTCRVLVLASTVAITFTFLPSNCFAFCWSSIL